MTVKDLDSTVEWYVKNLGFSVRSRMENKDRGTRIAFLETNGQAVLEFFGFFDAGRAVDGPTLRAEETGLKHISFYVDDLDKMCQALRNAGAEFTTQTPQRAVFKDPNGILVELRLS